MNLLTNALDAVQDESGVVTVSCEYNQVEKLVEVKISDNGCGIEKDMLEDIFVPFYSSKGQKGTGLGLAVAQKIINEHNGTIHVESTLGEGTSFSITLPSIAPQDPGETSGPARNSDQ